MGHGPAGRLSHALGDSFRKLISDVEQVRHADAGVGEQLLDAVDVEPTDLAVTVEESIRLFVPVLHHLYLPPLVTCLERCACRKVRPCWSGAVRAPIA